MAHKTRFEQIPLKEIFEKLPEAFENPSKDESRPGNVIFEKPPLKNEPYRTYHA